MKLRLLPKNLPVGTKALVRVDYNVPLKGQSLNRQVTNTLRLERSLATLHQLMDSQVTTILISHLGRPKGQIHPELSLLPVARALSQLINHPVIFCAKTKLEEIKTFVHKQPPGALILLENIRFFEGEKRNDLTLAKDLAGLANVFVNEAFSAAHRAHMSIVGLPKYLPAYAGVGFNQEVQALHQLMTKPRRPLVLVVGGAKISDKVEAINHLTKIANAVLVGGGVANNFLAADGFDIASSYLQDIPENVQLENKSFVHFAQCLMNQTKTQRLLKDGYIPLPKIIYPSDVLAASSPAAKTSQTIDLSGQNANGRQSSSLMYLDIGPKTIRLFKEIILSAGTVFWNGPMGVFEQSAFSQGTQEIARAVAKTSATTIIGGGETIAAINKFGLTDRYDYVSAAGGAALAFLAGKILPGIKPLVVE